MRTIGNLQISGSLITSGSITATTFIGDGSGLTGVTSYTDADTLDYINTLGVVSSSAQLSTEISGAFTSTSASLSSRTSTLEQFSSSLDTIFATDSELSAVSSSLASDIANNDSRLTTIEGKTLVSSSAQLSNTTIPGDLTVGGILTAQEFHTEFVSASIIYNSGSTQFGDTIDDTHTFTGTLSATTIQNVISSSAQVDYNSIQNQPTIPTNNNQLTNGAGYTTCVGDITGVTAGVGLSGGGTSGDVSLAVDLSELTDMTATMAGTDEFIVLDGGEDRRKAANEIGLSIFNNDSSFTSCTGTVTSVGGTGTVNGLTLTGTVTSTGNLTLGGTLGSITVSQLDGAAVQTSAEGFSDSDTVLMTAAAIEDRITGKGYTTCTGDITGVTAGTGITGGGTSGTVTINHSDTSTLNGAYGTNGVSSITVDSLGHVTAVSTATYSNCQGTVTSVATGTGLTGGTITSTGTISLSHLGFQNLTDPNADRVAFWDDSAGAFAWLTMGSNLSITDTTLNASGATLNNNVNNYVMTGTGTTGTLNGEANLQFNGSVLTVTGTVCATSIVETSAQKYKTDIQDLTETKYLNCLRPVSFKWKENGSKDIGFIAEEVNQFYPTLVAKSGEDEPTGVKYTKIVPLLVKKIQEQDKIISDLDKKLNDIYNKINKDT